MAMKPKLELTWIGKDIRPRLEPRILVEEPEFSATAEARRPGDIFDNLLIHGDNLLALKALESDPAVRGRVKCIFIDPPYNTGSAFEHYDDGLEHSLWLGMMRDRLEILRELLSEDGSIWITLDDNEAHYLKVLADEVFGRKNFVMDVIWEKKFSPQNDAKWLSDNHDHVLVWAKQKEIWRPNLLARSEKQEAGMKNPDNDPRGVWISSDYTCAKSKDERPNLYYPIFQPFLKKEIWPSPTRVWAFERSATDKNVADNLLFWGNDGSNTKPRLKKFPENVRQGTVARSVWLNSEVGNNQEARKETLALSAENPFSTPKPERLIHRIIHIATNPGDLVLDSFAGSGTTGAVAHKMGRRWIMVELGEHAKTHIVPRMRKVIEGADKGGVTEATGWKGGGGYRFCRLAPSLMQKDAWGNWVVRREYNPTMLAEAMCKHFNYTYAPSDQHYWMHGQSSEASFIYVTTASLTFEQLRAISDEVGPNRSLLICCMAYEAAGEGLANLTLRKIPAAVLNRCEWGKDDYSLKIDALPMMTEEEDAPPAPKSGALGDLFEGEK